MHQGCTAISMKPSPAVIQHKQCLHKVIVGQQRCLRVQSAGTSGQKQTTIHDNAEQDALQSQGISRCSRQQMHQCHAAARGTAGIHISVCLLNCVTGAGSSTLEARVSVSKYSAKDWTLEESSTRASRKR